MAKKAKETKAAKVAGKATGKGQAVREVKQPSLTTGEGLPPLASAKMTPAQRKCEALRKKAAEKAAVPVTRALAVVDDVLPPASEAEAMLKHPGSGAQLRDIELFIERGLSTSRKLDAASTFTAISIGTALDAAKAIIKTGFYEKWVETTFPNLSSRMAQYYCNVSKVFMRETDRNLALPPPKEIGTFLMRADQDSGQFAEAVRNFIGDLTLAELMDKHHIKPKKIKGGFKPSVYLVKRYQDEHAYLANKPYEVWGEKDQGDFLAWMKLECDDKSTETIIAAEAVWTSIRDTLTEHGSRRKSFAFLSKDQMSEISGILGLVKGNIDDALKGLVKK